MYYAPKLLLFIKKCLPNLPNLLYILICIVPLNDSFSLKNNPLKFTIYYVYLIYCHLNYPFKLKNVSLNFTISYIYLYVLSP